MAIPLIIDEKKIGELRKFAESHFIPIAEMRRIAEGQAAPVGERNGYDCNIDFGYRVAFSIEEHPRDKKDPSRGTAWLRHMSMSQVEPGRSPSTITMGLVGELLGFPVKNHEIDYEKCQIWMEDDAPNAVCEIEKSDAS